MSDDEDSDTGTFSVLVCPEYCSHFGGGKPLQPTVPQMQHAGPLVYSNWKAPFYRPVLQGCEAEEKSSSGGGTAGEL